MGLIYVNPEGPDGKPDPVASGRDVRETFARMAMNDYETVALIAGGHTFGKAHGAVTCWSAEPEAHRWRPWFLAGLTQHGSGNGGDTTTSGIEGAWKPNPTTWDMGYFKVLFGTNGSWKSPAGAHQWRRRRRAEDMIVDAHDPSKKHAPMMTTADLSPSSTRPTKRSRGTFSPIRQSSLMPMLARGSADHRDITGPKVRYLGPEVPAEKPDLAGPVAAGHAPAHRRQ